MSSRGAARLIRQSLWKRLPIYHTNPVYLIATRRFSVRTSIYTSAHQVPTEQQVNRLISDHGIATTGDATSLKTAAKKMIDARIGCLVVVDEKDEHEIVGLVTERDCMRAISENIKGLNETIIRDIMTPNEVIVSAKNSITSEDCFKIMLANNIRHLPLVDDEFVVCRVLSIKDVAASTISESDRKIHEKEEEAEFWKWRAEALDENPSLEH